MTASHSYLYTSYVHTMLIYDEPHSQSLTNTVSVPTTA